MRILAIYLTVSLVSILVTYLLHRVFISKKFIKYIPSLLFIIITIYNIYITKTSVHNDGFEDIARIVLAMFGFVAFISSLISSIILDKYSSRGN